MQISHQTRPNNRRDLYHVTTEQSRGTVTVYHQELSVAVLSPPWVTFAFVISYSANSLHLTLVRHIGLKTNNRHRMVSVRPTKHEIKKDLDHGLHLYHVNGCLKSKKSHQMAKETNAYIRHVKILAASPSRRVLTVAL